MTAPFDLEDFVGALRRAAAGEAPTKAVLDLMREAFADPARLSAGLPEFEADDTVLFEDETISVWHVRFQPRVLVPPHDHRTNAFIGVYVGAEENRLYRRGGGRLEQVKTRRVGPGEVFTIGPAGIHAVQAEGGETCSGIHVYLGPLTKIERSLFDWETGEAFPYNDEAYERLKIET